MAKIIKEPGNSNSTVELLQLLLSSKLDSLLGIVHENKFSTVSKRPIVIFVAFTLPPCNRPELTCSFGRSFNPLVNIVPGHVL